MVDATLRSIYSAADETIADLQRLHATDRERRLQQRANLDAVVARLDRASPAEEPDAPLRRERADADRRPIAADPPPFVALPQRTTHGGPFGPAVRDKLIAAALEKRGW